MSNLEPLVKIGSWYYQAVSGQLWPVDNYDAGLKQGLEPRLHSLLNFFLLHPNQLLSKDVLIEQVWPDHEGTDAAVMRAVGALRKILNDDARTPFYIATVSKKGYCWLADIEPLTSINPPAASDAPQDAITTEEISPNRSPWLFISRVMPLALLICFSLAYWLAGLTEEPLLKLPDQLIPISSLNGQEQWPILDASSEQVFYQYTAPNAVDSVWARQDLQSLRTEYGREHFRKLSAAVWFDEQHLIFRAETALDPCHFYRLKVRPSFGVAQPLWPCNQVMLQTLAASDGRVVWLDMAEEQFQIWQATPETLPQLVYTVPEQWRSIEHILQVRDTLYLLANRAFSGSTLLAIDLSDSTQQLQYLKTFPFNVSQLSLWDKAHLLLQKPNALMLFQLKTGRQISLGGLSGSLLQAQRYQQRILATQSLDYITDITSFRLQISVTPSTFSSWQQSNRSEDYPAASENAQAFVSERSGSRQIWLSQQQQNRMLTRLSNQQQIQQLFWHRQQLLAVLNSVLYQVDLHDGEINLLHQVTEAGRYLSCEDVLYWTHYEGDSWQLWQQAPDSQPQWLMNDVVDMRCAGSRGLVLQFSKQPELFLWQQQQLYPLSLQLDWRQYTPAQWLVNSQGIYWLSAEQHAIGYFSWQQVISWLPLPGTQLPVALYGDDEGNGYVVQPRLHDTDIVWLQNKD